MQADKDDDNTVVRVLFAEIIYPTWVDVDAIIVVYVIVGGTDIDNLPLMETPAELTSNIISLVLLFI